MRRLRSASTVMLPGSVAASTGTARRSLMAPAARPRRAPRCAGWSRRRRRRWPARSPPDPPCPGRGRGDAKAIAIPAASAQERARGGAPARFRGATGLAGEDGRVEDAHVPDRALLHDLQLLRLVEERESRARWRPSRRAGAGRRLELGLGELALIRGRCAARSASSCATLVPRGHEHRVAAR